MAENILEAYKSDIDYRINGTQPANKFGYKFNFHRLKNGVIFENEDLKVESFRVDHGGLEESYGFRFTSSDKVIVFSGDTGPSEVLESYAKDADILVHEVYSYAGFLNKTPDWQKYHKGHHTSTLELGEIAKRVKPKKLVLSHILFWGSTPDEIYEEISSVYDGEVIVAKDLMVIN
jgi:ribonuclease Z